MFDRKSERKDRIEEEFETAYDAVFMRIAERLKAEAIAEGADEDYRPSSGQVHLLVLAEIKKELQRRNDD